MADDTTETVDTDTVLDNTQDAGEGAGNIAAAAKPKAPTAVPAGAEDPAPAADATKVGDTTALEAALKKANREAAERRRAIHDMQAELDKLREANATEAEKQILAARKEAAEATEAKYRPAVVNAHANAALAAAGCADADVRKTLLRLVDTGKVEIGDDGDITGGLTEQVESLKAQFPEKFAKPRPAPASTVDAGPKVPAQAKKTVAQQLADRLTGATPPR